MPAPDERAAPELLADDVEPSPAAGSFSAVLDDWAVEAEIDSARWLATFSHERHGTVAPHLVQRPRNGALDLPGECELATPDEENVADGDEPIARGDRIRSRDVIPADEDVATAHAAGSSARRWSCVGWTATTLGLSAVACGSILAGWSLWGARSELWHVGLPMALAGQVAAVIGLMLLVDSPIRRQRTQSPHHSS